MTSLLIKKRKIMKKLINISIAFMFLALSVFAQSEPKAFAVKTESGVAIVCNNGNKSFAFEIKGKNVQSAQGGGMLFVVDEKLVQVNFVGVDALDSAKKLIENPNTISMMKLHQVWEMDYLSNETFKQKVSIESESEEKFAIANGNFRDSLFWSYKRPKDETSAYIGDAFQSTLIGNVVLVVGTTLEPNDDISSRKDYLTKVLSTIVLMDKELDPNASKPKVDTKPSVKKPIKRKAGRN